MLGSAERLDLPDLLSIDSYTAADFKYLVQSFIGADKPFILKGFDIIQPQDSIGTESISIRVSDSVVYFPTSRAGAFYYGLPEGSTGTDPLVPELRKNATNYVYLTFSTFDGSRDSRAFWDPDQNGGEGGEFSQDVNTQAVLTVEVNVSVSTFPEDVIPLAKIQVGPSVIESIQDCRDLMFRLGAGGVNPDPFRTFEFRNDPSSAYARTEASSVMTSSLDPNPFQGGDKNIFTLKEWMDVVMTRIKEISGDTYWYSEEGASGSGPNMSDTWHDALGSTLVSKGQFTHDESIGGRISWDEDITYKNLTDPRAVIIRPSTIDLADDNEVAYINLIRDRDINSTSTSVTWLAGSPIVNGVVGSFENLTKGDWIKKKSDPHPLYLRAEEFYALPDLAGGTTSPALAQSVKLNENYGGTTATDLAEYTQGEYLQTDIVVADRSDPTIHEIGGNFFWLGFRSDVIMGLQSIVPTQLSIDITQADGVRARVTSTAHGLIDQDRITITTGGYAGTYQVEVEDADNFFINTTVTGDELAQTAFYAIVTTRERLTDDGFELESATTSLKANQRVFIENTSSLYDGSYLVNPRSSTSFQIPYNALTPDPGVIDGEIVRVVKVNVKTEFGVVKVVQGESVDIGDIDSQNILSYIGMESLAQTKPIYNTPNDYNALDGHANYNSSEDDDLTERAAKLTAMMADRVQERGFSFRGRVNITSVTSGALQNISANGSLILHKPSSPEQVIDLTVSLPANSVAVANIDRDGSAPITLTVESLGSDYLLEENKYIMFYRFGDSTVYTWEDVAIEPSGHFNFGLPDDSSNRNIVVYNPGQIKLDPPSGLLELRVDEGPEVTRITVEPGFDVPQSSYFTLNAANDATEYYVWYNVGGAGVDPSIPGKTGIQVNITIADSADDVALATETAINTIASADMSALADGDAVTVTNNTAGSASDCLDGATPTGFDIDILCDGNDPDIEILIPGATDKNIVDVDVINGLGTLIIPSGAAAWVRVNRYALKTFNTVLTSDIPDTDANGAIYVTNISDIPTDQDVFVLWSRVGDSMVESHKAIRPDGNVYEEFLDVVAGLPANDYEIQGPVPAGTELQLPPDSRDGGRLQEYVVGSGQLTLFLRGQMLRNGKDWEEVGLNSCLSSRIRILQELEISDSLFWRIDAQGAVYFASDGADPISLQDAYDGGRFINVITGQPVTITGASGKLLSVQGDMDVSGLIDPTGMTFDPQAGSPISTQSVVPGVSYTGIWFNQNYEMVVQSENATNTAIISESGNLMLRGATGKVIVDSSTELNDFLDMNGQLLTDLTGTVTLGTDISLNDNLLLGGAGDITLGDNVNVNGYRLVNGSSLLLHYTGSDNFFAGLDAGNLSVSGTDNTGIGERALTSLTSGIQNTALGTDALADTEANNYNTAIGFSALNLLTTGDSNTAVGHRSLRSNLVGSENTAVGKDSLLNSLSAGNTAVGVEALLTQTSGSLNTGIGYQSLTALDTGAENTAIGSLSGESHTSGSYSVYIGAQADTTAPTADNQIAIGYGATVNAPNKARIGNDSLTTVEFAPSVTLQTVSGSMTLTAPASMAINTAGALTSTVGSLSITSTGTASVSGNLVQLIGPVTMSTTASISGILNMNNQRITNVADPVAVTDAARQQDVNDLEDTINLEFVRRDGTNSMLADLNMNSFKIVSLAAPVASTDAARKQEVDDLEDTINLEFIRRDGTNSMLADLNMNSFKITSLAAPVASSDAARKQDVDDLASSVDDTYLRLDGTSPMEANLNMDGFAIIGLLDPVNAQDGATKAYADLHLKLDGSTPMQGDINMDSTFSIVNLVDPSNPQDAATKAYADLHLKLDGSTSMLGNLDMNNSQIVNLADPINPQDGATKAFVESPDILKAVYVTLLNSSGNTIAAGSIVAVSTLGTCELASAASLLTSEGTVGIAVEAALNGENVTVQVAGRTIASTVGGALNPGKRVYLSTTAGECTATAPSSSGEVVYALGVAIGSDNFIIQPSLVYVNE